MVVCCICHDDLFRKGKSGTEDGTEREKGKAPPPPAQEQPVVTTKCGHLFHHNCLKAWFQKKGTEGWTPRECPVCQMTLTVATDLIRLFPALEDETGPSVEDFKAHIAKLENAVDTLRGNLESAFIRHRDLEKKYNQKMKENEQLQKAYILEKTKSSQYQTEAVRLKADNDELRNVIIMLNKNFASGMNGFQVANMTGMQFSSNNGNPSAGSPFSNYSGFSQSSSNNSQSVGTGIGRTSGGTGSISNKPVNHLPNISSSNKIELHEGLASLSLNNSQTASNTDFQSDFFDSFGGDSNNSSNGGAIPKRVGHSGDIGQEGWKDETGGKKGNSSRAGSDVDMKTEGRRRLNSSSSNNDKSSFLAAATQELRKLLPAHADFPDVNGNHGSGIVKDETPTDELMDAILKSKPPSSGGGGAEVTLSKSAGGEFKKIGHRARPDDFANEKKMYGKFFCDNCKAKWGTARHVYNKPQTCLKCKEIVFPYAQEPVMTKDELALEKLNRKRKT